MSSISFPHYSRVYSFLNHFSSSFEPFISSSKDSRKRLNENYYQDPRCMWFYALLLCEKEVLKIAYKGNLCLLSPCTWDGAGAFRSQHGAFKFCHKACMLSRLFPHVGEIFRYGWSTPLCLSWVQYLSVKFLRPPQQKWLSRIYMWRFSSALFKSLNRVWKRLTITSNIVKSS